MCVRCANDHCEHAIHKQPEIIFQDPHKFSTAVQNSFIYALNAIATLKLLRNGKFIRCNKCNSSFQQSASYILIYECIIIIQL